MSGFGFLAGIQQQNQNNRKRKRDEMNGVGLEGDKGKFMYKFKEGHSKNFKRELTFDFFL
jgi:hypothetical protein